MQIIDVTPGVARFAGGAAAASDAYAERQRNDEKMRLLQEDALRRGKMAQLAERELAMAEEAFAGQQEQAATAKSDADALASLLYQRLKGGEPQQAGPPAPRDATQDQPGFVGPRQSQQAPIDGVPPELVASFEQVEALRRSGKLSGAAAAKLLGELGQESAVNALKQKARDVGQRIKTRYQMGRASLAGVGLTGADIDNDGQPDDLDAAYQALFEDLRMGMDPGLVEQQLEMLDGAVATEVAKGQRRMVYAEKMAQEFTARLQTDASSITPEGHVLATAVMNKLQAGDYKFGEEGKAELDFRQAMLGMIPVEGTNGYEPYKDVLARKQGKPEIPLALRQLDTATQIVDRMMGPRPHPDAFIDPATGGVDKAAFAAANEAYNKQQGEYLRSLPGMGSLFPGEAAQGAPAGEPAAPPAIKTEPAQGMVRITDVNPAQARTIMSELADSFAETGKMESATASKLKVDVDVIASDPQMAAILEQQIMSGGGPRATVRRAEKDVDAQREAQKRERWMAEFEGREVPGDDANILGKEEATKRLAKLGTSASRDNPRLLARSVKSQIESAQKAGNTAKVQQIIDDVRAARESLNFVDDKAWWDSILGAESKPAGEGVKRGIDATLIRAGGGKP